MARRSKGSAGDDPHQLQIDWTAEPAATVSAAVALPSPTAIATAAPLVQRLPWDFKTSFPQPSDEAIDSGVLDESDRQPENLSSLHENYARNCLATLAALDKVMDARRRGIDPGTGNKPRTHASRERLRKYLAEEPARLEHSFEVLIGTYADAFGQEAADAFKKAIIARHAGIEVTCEKSDAATDQTQTVPKERKRVSSHLPVPRPLPSSVAAGVFGRDENGKPIRPGAHEVREITEQRAEKLIDLLDSIASAPVSGRAALLEAFQAGVAAYADDFGQHAAAQLEAYVRRQAGLDSGSRRER